MTVADCNALLPDSHAQQQRSTCMKLALRNGVMQLFWMPGGSHTWTEVAAARFRPLRRPRCPVPLVYVACTQHMKGICMEGAPTNGTKELTDF